MRRAELLELTGLSERTFDTLVHRGGVPFETGRARSRTWASYTGADAIALDLALALGGLGVGQVASAGLVKHGASDLQAAWAAPSNGDVVYFGVAQVSQQIEDEGQLALAITSEHVVGSFDASHERAKEIAAILGGDLYSITLVSVTGRVRMLVERAKRSANADALIAELNTAMSL